MVRRSAVALLVGLGLLLAVLPPAAGQTAPRTVAVHLFEWRWTDVARECEAYLGPKGYAAVQVSPPQEHVAGPQWWTRYQPVSYRIESRGGTRAQFADMVRRCRAAGVDVYADAVVNHMTGVGRGTGVAGSPYTEYSYPGTYSPADFHGCRRDIVNYQDRGEVQTCNLVNLADLDTGAPYVRDRLGAYLNDLRALGVAGFRIDAAKHIAAGDLQAIVDRVGGDPYLYAEVIDRGGEAVTSGEYFGIGDVTEFNYSYAVGREVRSGRLAALRTIGPARGFMPSDIAQVFTDNHDNQRSGSPDVVTYRDPARYRLANVFMLAWPYGYPLVMSGYDFTSFDQGPPTGSAPCTGGWTCEHRYAAIGNMVGFRNATNADFRVTDWWDDGDDRIAFGRGARGFVVLNGTTTAFTRTFQTSLSPGTYCDVVHGLPSGGRCTGPTVAVDGAGRATITVPPLDAVAVHLAARP